MVHCYEEGPRMAIGDDPLTGTRSGDCIPACIRVDSCRYPHAALLRVPITQHKRAGCRDVYELLQLIEETVNERRVT